MFCCKQWLWILFRLKACRKSCRTFAAPTKLVTLSLNISLGLPLRAMNLLKALMKESVSSEWAISMCILRIVLWGMLKHTRSAWKCCGPAWPELAQSSPHLYWKMELMYLKPARGKVCHQLFADRRVPFLARDTLSNTFAHFRHL